MITLDAIRGAVRAADPYTQIDRLVRLEMEGGRKVKEILGDIAPLVDMVLETQGLSKDGEEAFLGTLDALMGNCHEDCQYKDTPNTTLPPEKGIAKPPDSTTQRTSV